MRSNFLNFLSHPLYFANDPLRTRLYGVLIFRSLIPQERRKFMYHTLSIKSLDTFMISKEYALMGVGRAWPLL